MQTPRPGQPPLALAAYPLVRFFLPPRVRAVLAWAAVLAAAAVGFYLAWTDYQADAGYFIAGKRVSNSGLVLDAVPRLLSGGSGIRYSPGAATNGTVLVLAGLRTPWQREDQLSEDLKALQRNAILSSQSYVLAELNGTQFKVTRLYRSIPGIALRVGLDALQVLEKSPAVTNVVADRPVSVSR